jgi:hypothetical protein
MVAQTMLMELYYVLKPFIPRRLQIALRRGAARRRRRSCSQVWPIDPVSAAPPPDWSGWPEGKRFALVLTHDVDTARGQDRCRDLMKLEWNLGVRSSFNFVPERYAVSAQLRRFLGERGFEVGVHGLYHDGKLYKSREIFCRRAARINQYLKEWSAVGFRSPSMQHNLQWIHELNVEYDASTFDTDPFEPQPDGMRTIFPFVVQSDAGRGGYVELPYTIPQDSTLFVLLGEKDIGIWKEKLDWIVQHNGMALVNTHPDYMKFESNHLAIDEYDSCHYKEFLEYVLKRYEGQFWQPLPKEMARFWANRSKEPSERIVGRLLADRDARI